MASPHQTSDTSHQPVAPPSSDTAAPPPTGPRRWLSVPRLVAVGVVVATVAILLRGLLTPAAQPPTTGASSVSTPGAPAPQVGHLAPAISPVDLRNQRVSLADLRGKVVVLNFWYVACEPCQLEMPALEKAYRANAGRGLVVVGLDATDDAQTITEFVHNLGITYPIWRDIGQRAVLTYSVTATPTSYIIDRHGVIRVRYVGPFDTSTLNAYLQPLLNES